MNISFTPKLKEFVRRKVPLGLYNNASEVVREGLRLMIERDAAAQHAPNWLRDTAQDNTDQNEGRG